MNCVRAPARYLQPRWDCCSEVTAELISRYSWGQRLSRKFIFRYANRFLVLSATYPPKIRNPKSLHGEKKRKEDKAG